MPLLHTFSIHAPELGDTDERLLAKLLSFLTRPPVRGTALASAARTASTSSNDLSTAGYSGMAIWVNVTAASGTGGLTTYIQTKDPVSDNWCLSYVAAAPITTVRTTSILLGAGVSQGTNISLAGGQADRGTRLPADVRVYVVHGDASSYTYSVGYELIP